MQVFVGEQGLSVLKAQANPSFEGIVQPAANSQ